MQQVTTPRAAGRPMDVGAERVLRWATALFVAAFLFHNADHIRRGVGVLSPEVVGAGTLLSIVSVIAVVLVLLRHPMAPVAAVLVGFPGAVGVFATHLLPHWSALSDAFPGGHVDAVSWAAAISEVVALFVFGLAGLAVLRSRATAARGRT